MNKRILHCVLDEKFIDGLINIMDLFNDRYVQQYVNVTTVPCSKYKYIKNRGRVYNIVKENFDGYLRDYSPDIIILHSFTSLPLDCFGSLQEGIKVVWLAWGYDIYQPLYGYRPMIDIKSLYHSYTIRYMRKEKLFSIKEFFSKILKSGKKGMLKKAISRFDYFAGVIPNEYDLICRNPKNIFFRAKPVTFNYGDTNGTTINEDNINAPYTIGNAILVGNSADPTNNHVDAFLELSRFNLGDKRIIVPLSYAGTANYVSYVKKKGKEIFGTQCQTITSFMPLSEYKAFIDATAYSIFFIERQQAMGNIIMSLWNGNMVFMSENSPAYVFLKNKGAIIYTIQADLYRIENNEQLSEEEKDHNRKLMISLYSVDAVVERDKFFLETISEEEKIV